VLAGQEMMMKMRFSAVLTVLALLTASQAFAEARKVNNVASISAVDLSGRFRAEIVRGDQAGATLVGSSVDLDRLGVRMTNGTLKVWEKCTVFCGKRDLDVVVRIVSPQISAIEASKGVEVTATNVGADDISVDVAMGGTLRISGTCNTLSADVAMGGALSASDLSCRRVVVDAAMGGAASVRASESAVSEARMGGAVTIHGNPPQLDASGAMGGTTSRAD
jgi:Putative auto-transporter adhesin, head GIN domain